MKQAFIILIFLTFISTLGITTYETNAKEASDGTDFEIPAESAPGELLQFAKDLMSKEREFQSEEELHRWMQKMFAVVITCCDRVLAQNTEDHFFFSASGMKGQILAHLAMTKPDQLANFESYVESLEQNPRIQGNTKGREMTTIFRGILYQGLAAEMTLGTADLDRLQKFLNEVGDFVLQHPEHGDLILDLIYPMDLITQKAKHPEKLGVLLSDLQKKLRSASNPGLDRIANELDGVIRFTKLPGSKMDLEGRLLNNKSLVPNELEGKVVLLFFWSTWCEPYHAIYPELFVLYHQYHDQGLEFLGYSVDKELPKLTKYLNETKIPWPVLSSQLATENGQRDLAAYYGITDIPTMILIDRDGRVLSTSLDIDTLKKALEKLFTPKS